MVYRELFAFFSATPLALMLADRTLAVLYIARLENSRIQEL